MDINKLVEINIIEQAKEILSKDFKYKYPDQDILNTIFKDKVLLLDYIYNFQWHEFLALEDENNYTNKAKIESYIFASRNFKLIHFTGAIKPWTNPEIAESYYFWQYARKTPFYEDILQTMIFNRLNERKKISKYDYYKYKLKSKIPGRKQNYYIKKFENIEKKLAI